MTSASRADRPGDGTQRPLGRRRCRRGRPRGGGPSSPRPRRRERLGDRGGGRDDVFLADGGVRRRARRRRGPRPVVAAETHQHELRGVQPEHAARQTDARRRRGDRDQAAAAGPAAEARDEQPGQRRGPLRLRVGEFFEDRRELQPARPGRQASAAAPRRRENPPNGRGPARAGRARRRRSPRPPGRRGRGVDRRCRDPARSSRPRRRDHPPVA